jgi:hypothetical protein
MKEGRAQIVGEGEEGGRKKEVVEFKSRREDGRYWANASWARAHPMRVSCMQANVAASESPSESKTKNMHMFASIPSRMVPDHPAACYGARDPFRSQQTLSVVCLAIRHDV